MSHTCRRSGRALAVALGLLALLPWPANAQLDREHIGQDVPYVPTPANVVEAMLDIAKVGSNDFLIDLGSGDGRIVITAAKQRGARGFGVEIVQSLVGDARREAQRQGVSDRVQFLAQNLFITDIDQATVLTVYLYPNILQQLRPRIYEQLKPGTRIVSHEFDFGNWKPDAQVRVSVPDKPYGPPWSDVLLWIVPANAAGRWEWRMPVDGSEALVQLDVRQTFQTLEGTARIDGKPARIENLRLRGTEIQLVVIANQGGREMRNTLAGSMSGDTIRGTTRPVGGGAEAPWQASRVAKGKIDIEVAATERRLAAHH